MKYEFQTRIRYSETDSQGKLTWLGLLDYFQDCSVFQSESLGYGIDFLAENHKVWILLKWRICMERMPRLAEKVTVRTWAYDMKGFYGLRNFEMTDEQGRRLAWADTTWAYMDTESQKPVRVPAQMIRDYDGEDPIPFGPSERKIRLPEEYTQKEALIVPSYFIDTNHHMNNSRYVQVALSDLPEDFSFRELRVEYRSAAFLGDRICPRVTVEPDRTTINLSDGADKCYAVVQLL